MIDVQFNDLPDAPALKLERFDEGWRVPGSEAHYEIIRCDGGIHVRIEGKNYAARILKSENGSLIIAVDGVPISLRLITDRDRLLDKMGHSGGSGSQKSELKSPMPGMVLKLLVKAGDSVAKGDSLLILESMKMENVLKAAHNGVVADISAKEGTSVEKNQLLLRYK
jgi:biotin carboxyl carrier protein